MIMQWEDFKSEQKLTSHQCEQFKQYYEILVKAQSEFNITAITDVHDVITLHFKDSLMLDQFVDMKNFSMIADVGSGGGFPGIPLKIKYPHISLVLIEVNHKKINFLHEVFSALGLVNCEVSSFDWRTFLRKTEYPIELFCSRASLQPDELVHMFKPSCFYNKALLAYWASQTYNVGKEASFFYREESYILDSKKRKIVFFHKPKNG